MTAGLRGAREARDAARLRSALLRGLRERDALHDPAVEAALAAVPRHVFLPGVALEETYRDVAVVTRWLEGRPASSASQPAIVAIMLEQLAVERGARVLEVGAGTGYNAALLAALAGPEGRVVSVELDEDVASGARAALAATGVRPVEVVVGDGAHGHPPGAPYDRIELTAAAPEVLPAWVEQLAPGGRLVLPLVLGAAQASVALVRDGEDLVSLSVRPCGFMLLRGPVARSLSEVALGGASLRLGAGARAVDPQVLLEVLRGPSAEQPTGVHAGQAELCGGLQPWLATRTADAGWLGTSGSVPPTPSELVPPLMTGGGERATAVLVADGGLAVLAPGAGDRDLVVRWWGDRAAGDRLAGLVREWEAHDRPSLHGARLRVLLGRPTAPPPAGATVLDTPSTRVVVDWSPAASH